MLGRSFGMVQWPLCCMPWPSCTSAKAQRQHSNLKEWNVAFEVLNRARALPPWFAPCRGLEEGSPIVKQLRMHMQQSVFMSYNCPPPSFISLAAPMRRSCVIVLGFVTLIATSLSEAPSPGRTTADGRRHYPSFLLTLAVAVSGTAILSRNVSVKRMHERKFRVFS